MDIRCILLLAFLGGAGLCRSQTTGGAIEVQADKDILFKIPANFQRDLLELTGTKAIVEISSAVFVQTSEYKVYGIRVVLEHFPDLKRDIAEGVLIADVAYVIRPGTNPKIYHLTEPLSHLLNPNGIDFKVGFKPPVEN